MSKKYEESLGKSHDEQTGALDPAYTTSQRLPATETDGVRDGDVYRFAYNEASWERARSGMGHGDLNWAFDGQLVYRNGRLRDTYWGLNASDGRSFSVAEAKAAGALTFVCNLNDVEKVPEYEYRLYADGDAFNLSHQHGCYRHFVKRCGARKDAERMREAVHRKVQDAKDAIERATWKLECAVRERELALPRIDAGEEPSI